MYKVSNISDYESFKTMLDYECLPEGVECQAILTYLNESGILAENQLTDALNELDLKMEDVESRKVLDTVLQLADIEIVTSSIDSYLDNWMGGIEIPETIKNHIDYCSKLRDDALNNDIQVFRYCGRATVLEVLHPI